ncbi:unnamed protein product [Acanthoscelides obtectus]|uniref:Uncharacterized protein n=1 Tax=Acanthoscelides obtectus TaxID=200917 RepID=A0A9P0LEW1_ACAOB|nr:unnamed protein product [Acanthoscelides obtectus]CAK1656810.1 hypothetical protein AOBTE_LOCUS19925 [Acanthoscelides obtectus]
MFITTEQHPLDKVGHLPDVKTFIMKLDRFSVRRKVDDDISGSSLVDFSELTTEYTDLEITETVM